MSARPHRLFDRHSRWIRLSLIGLLSMAVGAVTWAQAPAQEPAVQPTPARCKVEGQVKSGTTPLPGVAVLVRVAGTLKAATSTDATGKFTINFAPSATYHLSAELTSFARAEQDLTLGAAPCDTKVEFDLALTPRTEAITSAAAAPASAPAAQPPAGQPPAMQAATTAAATPGRQGSPGAAAAAGAQTGRATAAGAGTPRFQSLNVQADASGAAALEVAPPDTAADVQRMLPPGFTIQSAQADAVAISGASDATSIDRSLMGDRLNAIGRGEFDPVTGQFAQGFGPGGGAGGDAAGGGLGQGGGRGGFGGGDGGGGRGGRGGPGGFTLGGRGGRGQSPYQGSTNYTYGGSALDATNLQPRNGQVVPAVGLPFARNTYGGTIGGPLKIPGLYDDTNRRTNFQFNYSGNHSTQLQDQYATVPTDAMRAGDFSSSTIQLVDPKTGQPYASNQIPSTEMDPAALALLGYIPRANVPGATTNNYHASGTTLSTSNSVSLRVTQNLSPNAGRGAGGRGGAGARGGGGGGRGGAGGRGGRGLNVMLTGQLQYRENTGQNFNAFPGLGGTTRSTSITAPISLNISQGRMTHNISLNYTRSKSTSSNLFSNTVDAAGLAGIDYPAAQDPLNWGVPNLTFSNFSLRSSTANLRTDSRATLSYSLSRPIKKHQVRIGGDFRHDLSATQSNSNARGAFTFTGLYTTNGAQIPGGSGADFADFLLGLPQQATLQVGGLTRLKESGFDLFIDDNWQKSSRLTLSLALRYEVSKPYVEVNGHMANLDTSAAFTQAAVVTPGQTSPVSGVTYPVGLLNTDYNNVGPRLGFAYRVARNTILRGGYSITYNSGSYASIARQLVGQPPFALTETNPGTLDSPLSLESGLVSGTATTTNNFGVDRNYALGLIQTWNGTISRDLSRNWTFIAGYTGTKGSDLDLLRAPNRNADGTLRIPDVQAFIWESSGGHSILNLGNFQLRRRLAHGFSGGLNYTLAKSMDNASSLGAGGAVVAQNDQDLAAEYALSNFDQRHQFTGDLSWQLPFGIGRKWLTNGGFLAAVVGEWTANFTVSAHSGSPFTARVVGATSSVANGTSGSLRANTTGAPVVVSDPTLLEFFNTAAFLAPLPGAFGTSPRNLIIGPGGHVVNASFSRDMRIGGNRAVSLQVNANNLFNTIQWMAIDTNVNSRTFGQVTRFAGMRTVTVNLRFRF